jgi:hypothetical protein
MSERSILRKAGSGCRRFGEEESLLEPNHLMAGARSVRITDSLQSDRSRDGYPRSVAATTTFSTSGASRDLAASAAQSGTSHRRRCKNQHAGPL